jgi:hypothetical protein
MELSPTGFSMGSASAGNASAGVVPTVGVSVEGFTAGAASNGATTAGVISAGTGSLGETSAAGLSATGPAASVPATSVGCCGAWGSCSALASPAAEAKAKTDEISATSRTRALRLRWPTHGPTSCVLPRVKSPDVSNRSGRVLPL